MPRAVETDGHRGLATAGGCDERYRLTIHEHRASVQDRKSEPVEHVDRDLPNQNQTDVLIVGAWVRIDGDLPIGNADVAQADIANRIQVSSSPR